MKKAKKERLGPRSVRAFLDALRLTVDNVVKNKIDKLYYLFDRWQGEQGYESWDDCIKVLRQVFTIPGFEFVQATSEPFEVVLRYDQMGVAALVGVRFGTRAIVVSAKPTESKKKGVR